MAILAPLQMITRRLYHLLKRLIPGNEPEHLVISCAGVGDQSFQVLL
jgi:hypothetical protein